MKVDLMIQSGSTCYYPIVEESISLDWTRKGSPGKLKFSVVKDGVISFQEGDPVKLTVDGVDMFYGFVFTKSRSGNTPYRIEVTAYDQLRYFKNKDTYNFLNKTASGKFHLTCETLGADPNGYTGPLIPIEYIDGLATAELTSIIINGEDEEDTETLRLRYLNSFANQSYGFNRGQYIEVVEALPGVGGCKPYRTWAGPGTVKLVITNSNYQPPSEELIEQVQTIIDPTQNSGEGIGLAPIDHEVTVFGADGETINIETMLMLAPGWELEDVMPYVEAALDAYYKELNANGGVCFGFLI